MIKNKISMQLCIVLTGYYFKYFDLYKKILDETELYDSINFNLYILSHKAKNEIPEDIYNFLIEYNWKIIYQPNIGWDWGCHVQFMQWHVENKKTEPSYILFLHDDISIVKNGFIKEFINKAKKGYELIGNSKPFTIINSFEKDYSDEAYILEKNNLNYEAGKIEIFRGSAFFISFKVAVQTLSKLPYQKCGSINLANRSLRMFGAIATKLVGGKKIGYLSDEHFESDYITEEMRGSDIGNNFFLKRYIRSNLTKMFFLSERIFISPLILKHSYPVEIENKLKINFTEDEIKQGYLNICLNGSFCSDISLNDFEKLLSDNRIYRIVISTQLVFSNTDLLNSLLFKLHKSTIPIDLFIDTENINRDSINQLSRQFHHLKITVEKIPKKKGIKLVNRLYIKYPQKNFKFK